MQPTDFESLLAPEFHFSGSGNNYTPPSKDDEPSRGRKRHRTIYPPAENHTDKPRKRKRITTPVSPSRDRNDGATNHIGGIASL